MISLKGLNKADVLAVLYNASRPQGMGFLQYDPKPMTSEEAQQYLDKTAPRHYFDYLNGRVMKVDLSKDDLEERLYDRDNGQGAAERAINVLRSTKETQTPEIQASHRLGVAEAAVQAEDLIETPHSASGGVVHLTLDDVKEDLAPKVKQAVDVNK